MKLKKSLQSMFKALFHKRNIIIMSERSTSHMSMSGKLQFLLLFVIVSVIGAGSFSTGKYMSAREVIDTQDKVIKSVAKSRVEDSFNYGIPRLSNADGPDADTPMVPLKDPNYAFSNTDETKLIARIAMLEGHIRDLNQTNKDIIKVVRKTAAGQVKDLEKIIQQTGVSPKTLKRHAQQEKKILGAKPSASLIETDGHKGGPYIPEHWDSSMVNFVESLEETSRELYVLRQILNTMPIAKPMADDARLTSSYGRRRDPFTGRVAFHAGIDFASRKTPQIAATADGVVSIASRKGAYGKLVEIEHGLGLSTRYGHLKSIFVAPGQRVKKGQVIGLQGSTGRSTGAHLHYEVRFNNRPVNPRGFLEAGESYEEAYVSETQGK